MINNKFKKLIIDNIDETNNKCGILMIDDERYVNFNNDATQIIESINNQNDCNLPKTNDFCKNKNNCNETTIIGLKFFDISFVFYFFEINNRKFIQLSIFFGRNNFR